MSENQQGQGIYINGKQQIIDMLRFMNESEREKLLNNIKSRNASMAKELSEQSFSFKDIVKLTPNTLRNIFSQCNPAIVGLALYTAPAELQRKVLSSLEREAAEQAFQVMSKNLDSKKIECSRAQEKILRLAIQLSRKQQINI